MISGLDSPGEGKGYPLQDSGLENSMDCIAHGITKSRTQLSSFHSPFKSILLKDKTRVQLLASELKLTCLTAGTKKADFPSLMLQGSFNVWGGGGGRKARAGAQKPRASLPLASWLWLGSFHPCQAQRSRVWVAPIGCPGPRTGRGMVTNCSPHCLSMSWAECPRHGSKNLSREARRESCLLRLLKTWSNPQEPCIT